MKKTIILLILLCSFGCWRSHCQTVSQTMARQVAENFWNAQSPVKSPQTFQVYPLGDTHYPTMYVFSSADGWVLVAGDKRVAPILAYSDEKGREFPAMEDVPPSMQYLFDSYRKQIEAIRNGSVIREYNQEWHSYLDINNGKISTRSVIVSPLLTRDGHENAWAQDENDDYPYSDSTKIYNKFCPPRNGCAHAPAGCGAVSLGQIMWYWQWPYAKKTFYNYNRVVSTYNWDMMPYGLSNSSSIEEADMIATLLHDIGVAENMNYHCDNSGTNIYSILHALRDSFYYSADEVKERVNYTNDAWINSLKGELNEQRPVLYGGRSGSEGHFFVIDGYNSNNYFHANIGWGGMQNFYYNLNEIYPSDQVMITNIHPNYDFYCSPYTVPWWDIWPTNFFVQHGGRLTLEEMIFTNGMHGYIYSEESVKLDVGVYVEMGAEVYIGINGSLCSNGQAPASAPRTAHEEIHTCENSLNTSTVTKIFRDGELYILREGKVYNSSGIRIK